MSKLNTLIESPHLFLPPLSPPQRRCMPTNIHNLNSPLPRHPRPLPRQRTIQIIRTRRPTSLRTTRRTRRVDIRNDRHRRCRNRDDVVRVDLACRGGDCRAVDGCGDCGWLEGDGGCGDGLGIRDVVDGDGGADTVG